jgi:hypothetical protein
VRGVRKQPGKIRDYLPGIPYCYTSRTPYNEGDGITMAMSVGAELAKSWIRTAGSLADLASVVGLVPATLAGTVSRWNHFCAANHDPDFGRTLMMPPIVNRPFYAIKLSPSMLNTQRGPRRNEKGQIVRPDGTPIARLYSAGELGSIYRAPEISGNAWRSAASQGAMQPETPWE